MKLKETIITYSILIIMCVGISIGFFFDGIGVIISNIVTALTAIISAITVYVQMKKDAQITQAEFLLEFSKVFYSYEGAPKLEEKIDRAMEKNDIYKYTTKDYELVNDYMIWLSALASMVENKTLSIKIIDNIYNYRFFTLVNNPYVQKYELIPFAQFYRSIYVLHEEWVIYRKKHGKKIIFDEFELSKQENYKEIVKRSKNQSV